MSFGSNHNYFLCNNGEFLTGVNVTIDITEDMVGAFSTTASITPEFALFTFQLNAYSTMSGNAAWQQFVFTVKNTASIGGDPFVAPPGAILSASVETWPSAAFAQTNNIPGDLINSGVPFSNHTQAQAFVRLPGQKLPAGYQLKIALGNDRNGNINAATFTVHDNNQNLVMTETIKLPALVTDNPSAQVTAIDLSPIVAYQLNIVGTGGGTTLLLSGAGTIRYGASTMLTAELSQPAYSGALDTITQETSNVAYGPLPSVASNSLIQTFATVTYPVGGRLVASPLAGNSNQTDLFAIGSTGQLGVFSVQQAGVWQSMPPLGPLIIPFLTGPFAPPGAPIAVSPQFGALDQTDIFLVDNTGHLNVFWITPGNLISLINGLPVGGPLQISGPGFAAPPGAWVAASQRFGAAGQTDVYVVDNNGQLNVFSVVDTGNWTGPHPIGPAGFAPPGAGVAASQQYGIANQTDVFVVDTNGQVNVFWTEGTGNNWGGPLPIGGPGFSAPPGAPVTAAPLAGVPDQTNVFVVDNDGQLNALVVDNAGAWRGVTIGPAFYPDPSGAPNALPGTPVAVSPLFGSPGQTNVFEVDVRGSLTTFSTVNGGPWSGSQTILEPGFSALAIGPGSCIAASQQFGLPDQTDVFVLNNLTPWLLPGLGWPSVLWNTGGGGWSAPFPVVVQV